MVALFVRLKWALVTSRIRTASAGSRTGMVIGLVAGLIWSGVLAVALGALVTRPDIAAQVIGTVFTVQLVAWVLAPLVAFGIDETVDPRRFALLPLTAGTLRRGLLASAVIGYLPIFNIVLLLGAAVGMSPHGAVFPLALICSAAQLAMCVIVSRAAATSMAALMSSRRGRDLGMMVGLAVLVVYFVGVILLNTRGAPTGGDGFAATARALTWGPTGALAQIPTAVAEGDMLRLVVAVATAGLAGYLGWRWWGWALERSMTTISSTTAASSPAHEGVRGSTVASSLWTTARLVAARDLRLAWRDPGRRLAWLVVALFTVGWPLIYQGAGAQFAVVLGALMIGGQTANYLAVDGSGLWLHLVAVSDRMRARGEMAGHAVATIVPGLVLVAVGLALQVMLRGHPELLPASIGVCVSALLGTVGGACWMTAVKPFPMPQNRRSVFASSVAGRKGAAMGASLAVLGVGLATALPAVAAAVPAAVLDRAWGLAGVATVVVCAVPVLLVLIRLSADRYLARGPEILAVAALGDRA